MNSQYNSHQMQLLTAEAARIFCEESVWNYRSAKIKALQRLRLPPRSALPDNQHLQAAVIEYQRLYGGTLYLQGLRRMRETAVQALRLLTPFNPCLTGAAVTGATTAGQRVQIHAFAEPAEAVDLMLADRQIPYSQGERRYRYPNGSEQTVPLAKFQAGEVGVDVAVFASRQIKQTPLSPSDGLPMIRLRLNQVEDLIASQVGSV